MYINVRLLKGWREQLIYKLPDRLAHTIKTGSLVRVPLRHATELALVEEVFERLPDNITYTIKEIYAHHELAEDSHYQEFISKLSSYYALEPLFLYKRLANFLKEREETTDIELVNPDQPAPEMSCTNIVLTDEQQVAVDTIVPYINEPQHQTFVLHGVTGSGKTEVYARLIEQNYRCNKTTLLLLPEVSLAVEFSRLFKKRFDSIVPIFSFHSATSVSDKRALWHHINQQKACLIIGVHLPILLPISRLGLIIMDEEHDLGYQTKKHPKLNIKEAALIRAQILKIPIVLGSATPAITTLYGIEQRGWKLLTLKKRFAGAFPQIQVAVLDPKKKRTHFWLSEELEAAINDRLEKKEQSLIFLNRRGYSFFVQCLSCTFIFRCDTCSVSLTFHESDILLCHYCGTEQKLPATCPTCKKSHFLKKGIGTQQIVTILQKIFPHARIGRADQDVTVHRKKWQATMAAFANQELDILVGTQTITKGYHFPHVTLVGIIWADMHLNFPAYNATETTLQQLIQVAGRAGRQRPNSMVVLQTMMQHQLYKFLNESDYMQFYAYEMAQRTQVQYPPLIRFAELELRNTNEKTIEHDADAVAELLESLTQQQNLSVTILGPAQPPVHKIKNVHMRKIYLKAARLTDIINLYHTVRQQQFASLIFFTPNPLGL